jgi:hypothetical protein
MESSSTVVATNRSQFMKSRSTILGLLGIFILAGLLALAPALAQNLPTFGEARLTMSAYKYSHITAAAPTTTTIKTSPGLLHSVCVNTAGSATTATIYDAASAVSPVIALITTTTGTNPCFIYDVYFTVGLTIVTATAASDITVSYY